MAVSVPLSTAAGGGSARVALPTGKTLDVAIPAGVEDGKQIRLRGQGRPGARNGPPGDAIVTIHYAPHPQFKVEGRDLKLDLPITLYEAVLGGQGAGADAIGRSRDRHPAGTSSGRALRLRGKGLPASGDAPAGDLLATLRIVMPAGDDADLAALMRRLARREALRSARRRQRLTFNVRRAVDPPKCEASGRPQPHRRLVVNVDVLAETKLRASSA